MKKQFQIMLNLHESDLKILFEMYISNNHFNLADYHIKIARSNLIIENFFSKLKSKQVKDANYKWICKEIKRYIELEF